MEKELTSLLNQLLKGQNDLIEGQKTLILKLIELKKN